MKITRKKRKSDSGGGNVPVAGEDNKKSSAELEGRLREAEKKLLETNTELLETMKKLQEREAKIESLLKSNGVIDELTETKGKLAATEMKLLEAEAKIERLQNGSKDGDDDDDISGDGKEKSFELDTKDPWNSKYTELREYLIMNGHCKVPREYEANRKLGYWVNNQRICYRNVKTGNAGRRITEERISLLEGLGFSWGQKFPAPISWDERFEELQKFQKAIGHCNINVQASNPSPLAKWVSAQRLEYRLLKKGRTSILSLDQVSKLNGIGFKWNGPHLS